MSAADGGAGSAAGLRAASSVDRGEAGFLSPRTTGPVEKMLRQALLAVAPTEAAVAAAAELQVELLPSSNLGNFRVDLRPLLGDLAFDREAGREFGGQVGGLALVDTAVSVPPRLYLRVPVPSLYSVVVDAIEQDGDAYGCARWGRGTTVFVAFSDPNINKPLHLGHFRNNFIGMSLAALLSGTGHTVERHTIHTDWGIHICQALVAYLKWGHQETPAGSGEKGDHLVGRYYVMFHAESERQRQGGEDGESRTPLEGEAADILRRLAAGDDELRRLHDTFVGWADLGIRQTYDRIGTTFEEVCYESHHLDRCDEVLERAIALGQCLVRADGSAFVDLSDIGVGPITLRRQDGTPVVYSQWIAVDCERFGPRVFDSVMVLLGQEWEPGYSVMLEILKRFGEGWASRVEPLYYGMVKLPEGRMKSRTGSGLTGDGLLDRVRDRLVADHRNRTGSTAEAPGDPFGMLAVALVKYHLVTARRSKDVLYREEDLWKSTLPRVARILALHRAHDGRGSSPGPTRPPSAKALGPALLKLDEFPRSVEQAVVFRDPAVLVRFLDGLAATATACRWAVPPDDRFFGVVDIVLRTGLRLLNIELPASSDLPHLLKPGARPRS